MLYAGSIATLCPGRIMAYNVETKLLRLVAGTGESTPTLPVRNRLYSALYFNLVPRGLVWWEGQQKLLVASDVAIYALDTERRMSGRT